MPLTSTCTLLHLLQCHILGLSSSSGYVYVRSLCTCTSLLLNGTALTWSEVKGKEGGADHTQTLGSAPLHNMLQLNTTFLLISVLTCTCVFFTAQAHVHIYPLTTAHAHPQTHGNGVMFISHCHVVARCNKCDIAPFTYIFPPLGMHLVGFMLSCIFNVSDYNTM